MTHPIILAAGFGRRMRPLSDALHKTMITLHHDRTILGGILHALRKEGFESATIVTGYRAQDVMDYARTHAGGLRLDFVHNPRYEATNNIHSLALAFEHVDVGAGILLIESDLVFDHEVLAQLVRSPHADVALVDRYRPGMDGTVVQRTADGYVERVVPSAQQGPDFEFDKFFKTLNMYKFSGPFCEGAFGRLLKFYSHQVNDNCFYELVIGMIVATGQSRIFAEVLDGPDWAEVDDPIDLQQARFLMDPDSRYALLTQAWGGYWGYDITDFAFIRNMYFPTPAVVAEMRMQLPELMVNYGSAQTVIDQKVAWLLGCDAGEVVALNGASQAFPLLSGMLSGRPALIPGPTFGEWARCFPAAQVYDDDASGSLPEQLPPGAVLVVVNPNNPTGTSYSTAAILRIARANPEATVLVDESFIDFSEQPSVLGADPGPNIAVLKSLSKSLGVPGLRLGYLASRDTDLVAAVRAALPVWNLNSVAEKFLELLFKNRDVVAASYAATVTDRQDLRALLLQSEIVRHVWPSSAQFLLTELRLNRVQGLRLLETLMADHKILVKDVSARWPDDVTRLRVAVRTPTENRRLVAALNQKKGEVKK